MFLQRFWFKCGLKYSFSESSMIFLFLGLHDADLNFCELYRNDTIAPLQPTPLGSSLCGSCCSTPEIQNRCMVLGQTIICAHQRAGICATCKEWPSTSMFVLFGRRFAPARCASFTSLWRPKRRREEKLNGINALAHQQYHQKCYYVCPSWSSARLTHTITGKWCWCCEPWVITCRKTANVN